MEPATPVQNVHPREEVQMATVLQDSESAVSITFVNFNGVITNSVYQYVSLKSYCLIVSFSYFRCDYHLHMQ